MSGLVQQRRRLPAHRFKLQDMISIELLLHRPERQGNGSVQYRLEREGEVVGRDQVVLLRDYLLAENDSAVDPHWRATGIRRLPWERAFGRFHRHRLAARNVKTDYHRVHGGSQVVHIGEEQVANAAAKQPFTHAAVAKSAV